MVARHFFPRGIGSADMDGRKDSAQTHTNSKSTEKALYIGIAAALILHYICINDRMRKTLLKTYQYTTFGQLPTFRINGHC